MTLSVKESWARTFCPSLSSPSELAGDEDPCASRQRGQRASVARTRTLGGEGESPTRCYQPAAACQRRVFSMPNAACGAIGQIRPNDTGKSVLAPAVVNCSECTRMIHYPPDSTSNSTCRHHSINFSCVRISAAVHRPSPSLAQDGHGCRAVGAPVSLQPPAPSPSVLTGRGRVARATGTIHHEQTCVCAGERGKQYRLA